MNLLLYTLIRSLFQQYHHYLLIACLSKDLLDGGQLHESVALRVMVHVCMYACDGECMYVCMYVYLQLMYE